MATITPHTHGRAYYATRIEDAVAALASWVEIGTPSTDEAERLLRQVASDVRLGRLVHLEAPRHDDGTPR